MESTLCWAEAEYRAAQGSLHNPRQDIHYCHKPPSQQNRRAGFIERTAISTGSDFMLLAVFLPAAETNPTQPPPLFFHCARRLPSRWQPTNVTACRKWPSRSGGWSSPSWATRRRGIGFHRQTRALFAAVCALKVVSFMRKNAPVSLW